MNTPTVNVTISNQARNQYLQLKQISKDDELGRQLQNARENLGKKQLDQLEHNKQLDDFIVKHEFRENTLEHTIYKALEGKIENASLYAIELASALRSYVSMPEKSVEERIAFREMALKQAEYISQHYFEDEDEATSFMEEIAKYYENDVLREKGYIVIDNSNVQPFKKYSSPNSIGDDVSFRLLAEKFMGKDYLERFINGKGTPEETAKYLLLIKNNKEKYRQELSQEFEANKKLVEEKIEATKALFESFVWENGLVAGPKEDLPSYIHNILNWNKKMLSMIKPKSF